MVDQNPAAGLPALDLTFDFRVRLRGIGRGTGGR
jgi:hypothetical protein